MKTKLNIKKLENFARSFYLILAIAAVPALSYLTFTHKEKTGEKTTIVYNLKTPVTNNM